MTDNKDQILAPLPRIEEKILLIRGERIILDETLAALYGVPLKGSIRP
jgi:hypothetical protein